ncbi:hypothetical protein QYE76_038350 [Lolium multiflorum]|uniref:Uncharacterized protein n=1 Tax=Lolium multiflorum TaxID=4521 RepID=A0AAD8T8P6_LOLMU|nr:hypothetical protein QYE76_038350 [Lolium multiflorum]
MKIIQWISAPEKKQRGFHGGLTGWCTDDRNYCTGASVVEITAPEPRYPVDDIKEMKACHLYYPIGNMSMKGRKDLEMSSASSFYGEEVYQVSRRGANKSTPTVVVAAVAVVVVVLHLHLLHVADAAPIHLRRKQPLPLVRPGRAYAPPIHLREEEASWIINPDPYVPKKTKVPEPSLKPLPTRPWERSAEEVEAAATADLEKWKAAARRKESPSPSQYFR